MVALRRHHSNWHLRPRRHPDGPGGAPILCLFAWAGDAICARGAAARAPDRLAATIKALPKANGACERRLLGAGRGSVIDQHLCDPGRPASANRTVRSVIARLVGRGWPHWAV